MKLERSTKLGNATVLEDTYHSLISTSILVCVLFQYELRHDKTNKLTCAPQWTQISLVIGPVWSASSLSVRGNLGSFIATHWEHSKDLNRPGECPGWSESLLGTHAILLVLSWGGSFVFSDLPVWSSQILRCPRYYWNWSICWWGKCRMTSAHPLDQMLSCKDNVLN